MMGKSSAETGVMAAFFAAIARLPGALRTSLNPETETEARIVEGQLDRVRASIMLFDYALPFGGAVIFFLDRFHSKFVLGIWSAVLILTCMGNEIFLNRFSPSTGDIIQRARIRSRHKVVICLLLTVVWSSVAIWLWNPVVASNQIFVELILCCTLAALACIASLHAASVAGPMFLVSASVLLVPLLKDIQSHPVLVGLSIIYVLLMVWHACMIQIGSARMLKLENERTELIENLRKAKMDSDLAHQHAVAASRAKSEFLANMSHELRTPLNAIIGFSDIVQNKSFGDSPDRYSEYGAFIHQSGHHLLDLIGDILDLAKIEAGRKILNYEPVDLAGVVADEVLKAEEAAQLKGISIEQNIARNLPLLKADPYAVRQILGNLLSNAVKFTPQGGHVEVSATLSAEREIAVTVSDTGIGIAPADQAYIFERSGHVHPEVTAAHRGMGLGLSIVKGLVDMHAGRIVLKSTLGEGTSVSVIFPAASTVKQSDSRAA